MKNNFKAILFDLGNVVIDFDHLIAVKKIAQFSKLDKDKIYQTIFDSDLTSLFEEGLLSEREFFYRIKDMLKFDLSYNDFLPIWNEIFFITPRNLFVHNIARQLKKDYSIFLISNVNKLHFQYLKETFDIFKVFKKLILSYEVKARKPNPVIYNLALKYAACRPQEILYFDDRQDLIEAARDLKINGFQFTGIDSFKKTLESLGISYRQDN